MSKDMEGHRSDVHAVAVSRDGQLIASGDQEGKLIAWHGKTGEPLTQPHECIDAHSKCISSLDFSPDCTMMASGSFDRTIKLWSTTTWQVQGDPIQCGDLVCCVRYSPSGEFLAIATDLNIAIYDSSTRKSVANLKDSALFNVSLAWTPDSTCLLSAGDHRDPTIREWDTSTWTQVGDPWTGHTDGITAITVNFGGTVVASASRDNHVRLWQLSDRRTIAIFKHSDSVNCVSFLTDGRHILSGGGDKKIEEWDAEWEAEIRRALIVAVGRAGPGYGNISQVYKDALRMKDFLVNSRGYLPENIIIMMHDVKIQEKHWPSRHNILREIDFMVRRTSPHHHLFFYYTGYGDQVTCKHNTERDGKDEAILTYTGKRIIDHILKEHLVDPLPQGAKLFALWDCSHSHTLLDLEHYECNELWSAPFKVLSGLGRKTQSFGESPSARFLKDSSEDQSSIKDNKSGSLTTDNMGLGPRASSPDTYLPKCTLDCPLTLPEERVKPHVVSLSACRDDEMAYDNVSTDKHESLTKFFIDYLERNPKASYHDLLSYIRHKVDGITRGRTQVEAATRETFRRLEIDEVGIEDRSEDHHSLNEDSIPSSQRPSYASRYRLDMLEIVDL